MNKLQIVEGILDELRPYAIPFTMRRYGNPNRDGGYGLLKKFTEESLIVYSLGVGVFIENILFDLQMADSGKRVYLYDDNLDELPKNHENFTYKRSYVSSENASKHIEENGHKDETDILGQIDIEGAEYELFSEVDESYFKHFSQLSVEFHDLHEPTVEMLNVFKKLNKYYYIYHIHANNNRMVFDSEKGILPQVLEICFLRKDKLDFNPYFCKIPRPINGIDKPCRIEDPDIFLQWWCD